MPRTRDLEPDDAPALTRLYEDYGWWAARDVEGVRRALRETDVAVGLVDGGDPAETGEDRRDAAADGELVAAARVLTDHTYYATVYDVVVAADRRGEGLGERLLEAVVEHPELQDPLPGLSLSCRRGLVPFYESVGFERFDPEVELPEGRTEELVRMTCEHGD